jgi:hypothetical protein
MPQTRLSNAIPPPAQGFGAIPNQMNRPGYYGGTVTINGHQYQYGTGGGRFPSLPYGTYYLHPGAIGSVGRRIGAIAGISDSNNPRNNTVNDPKLGRGRDGVEVHFSRSGRTNGCFGVRGNWGGFRNDFAAAARQGPLVLHIDPGGNATIGPMGAAQVASRQNFSPRQDQRNFSPARQAAF